MTDDKREGIKLGHMVKTTMSCEIALHRKKKTIGRRRRLG